MSYDTHFILLMLVSLSHEHSRSSNLPTCYNDKQCIYHIVNKSSENFIFCLPITNNILYHTINIPKKHTITFSLIGKQKVVLF